MDADSVTELIGQIGELIRASHKDATKNDNGNEAAGVRIRKAMQDVKSLAQSVREQVLINREKKALSQK
tara:strand:- start:1511 stop:1717 length:207 start_codon:yes stop_codon:yes gene_type:complete